MAAVFALGTFTFPSGEQPGDGDLHHVQKQRWAEFEPIGAASPGTLLTYLGSPSIKHTITAYVSNSSRDSLTAIYNARGTVLWTTPWDGTGYAVQMTELDIIKDRSVRGTSRWKATMTLVKAT
jgi:hypothetical protein